VSTPPLLLLLPPSEGKAPGGRATPWTPDDGSFGSLAPDRRAVVAALAAVGGGDQALLGVGGRHLERARDANLALVGHPATLPAWRRYTGVVHDHLGVGSLSRAGRQRALTSVVVLSGLLGAVGLGDPVPDYRIKMGARLPPLGLLTAWWRPRLAPVLAARAVGHVVVDLLPVEHAAAVDHAALAAAGAVVVRARLVERDGRAGGHDAKAAKGRLARHLITSRAHPERALRAWRDDRYVVETEPVGAPASPAGGASPAPLATAPASIARRAASARSSMR
jgi:uncharacterized protein